MADRISKEQRSQNMAAIKGKDTKPELFIRHELFFRGYRYRKNVNYIYGHPDLFLRKYDTAIFVHGCFWHRHEGCKYSYTPKTRTDYWERKFEANVNRDRQVIEKLKSDNIKCLIIWECTVRKMKRDMQYKEMILHQVESFLLSEELYAEY